jgi:hypothetical protein
MGHTLGNRSVQVWTILRRLGDGDLRVSFFKRDGIRDKKRVERLPIPPMLPRSSSRDQWLTA